VYISYTFIGKSNYSTLRGRLKIQKILKKYSKEKTWESFPKREKNIQNCSLQILIPTLNEEPGIGPTINELNKKLGNQHILIIDGNSLDKTVEVAKQYGAEILYQKGKGKGLALFQGVKHNGFSASYIIFIDADYTYPAKYIPLMIDILNNNPKVGMVCGNRFNNNQNRKTLQGPFYLGNKLLSIAHNILNGIELHDPLTGLRVIRATLLRGWSLNSKGFDIEVELNYLVKKKGFSIVEIPIKYRHRLGDKKLKILDGIIILKRIIKESVCN
jgi:dolichol-phosphate mannosyltransferase